MPCVSGAGGATTQTTIKIEFRDWAGTLITTPTRNMKVFVRHGRGGGRYQVDPATIDTTAFPYVEPLALRRSWRPPNPDPRI